MQGDACIDCLTKIAGPHRPTGARNLHENLIRVAIASQDDGQPGHPLSANNANLDRTLAAIGHYGREAAFWKVDCRNLLFLPLQDLAERKVDRFEVSFEKPVIR